MRPSTACLLVIALLAVFPLLGSVAPVAHPAHPAPVFTAKPLHHAAHRATAHRATVAPLARCVP